MTETENLASNYVRRLEAEVKAQTAEVQFWQSKFWNLIGAIDALEKYPAIVTPKGIVQAAQDYKAEAEAHMEKNRCSR